MCGYSLWDAYGEGYRLRVGPSPELLLSSASRPSASFDLVLLILYYVLSPAANSDTKTPRWACIKSDTQYARPRTGHLLRVLGAGFGIAVGVGTTIGSGILRTPGEVAGQLGSASLVLTVWILGGVYALLCCSSVTELATMLPNTGGFYAYASRAFGRRIGFVVGCCNAMVESVAMAYLSVALGEFAAGLFPRLAGHVQLVGVTGLILLTLFNWTGLRPGSRAQEFTSAAKALGLIGLVIACFVSPAASGASVVAKFSIARTQPFPGIDSCPTRRGRYLRRLVRTDLLCGGRSRSLAKPAPLHDRHCAHLHRHLSAGECCFAPRIGNGPSRRFAQLPAADAAMLVFGSYGRQFILLISVVGVLSTINAGLMLTPRILFSMARDGLLPQNVTTRE